MKFHKNFSRKLSEYALNTAKEIEKPKNSPEKVGFAKVIYAGGDDIFAFLHGSEIIRTLKICSINYKEKLKELDLLKEGKATTSAGVVLGHAKVSLRYLYKKTKEAESKAKKVFGRNAFVIKVISRSGEESEFGAKYIYSSTQTPNKEGPKEFNTLNLLEKVIKYYAEGKISSKLPYSLREIAKKFLAMVENEKDKEKIAKALLKRELSRKINLDKENKEKLIEDIKTLFELQLAEYIKIPQNKGENVKLTVEDILRNIAGMFYVARKLSDFMGVENYGIGTLGN